MTTTRLHDVGTIGGRLRIERARLQLSQPAFAAIAGVTKGAVLKWETGGSFPNAEALAAFAEAGADVLFIITGRFALAETSLSGPTVDVCVSRVLAHLDTAVRRSVLLELLADELRA